MNNPGDEPIGSTQDQGRDKGLRLQTFEQTHPTARMDHALEPSFSGLLAAPHCDSMTSDIRGFWATRSSRFA